MQEKIDRDRVIWRQTRANCDATIDGRAIEGAQRVFIERSGENDHRTRADAESFDYIEPVDAWHLNIKQQQIWLVMAHRLDGRRAELTGTT